MSLTPNDIAEIKATWAIPVATPSESGQAILLEFFRRYPANLQKFKDFKDMTLDELKVCPRFKAHANKIINTFDEAIKTLGTDDAPAALQKIWTKIAASHVKRGIAKQSYIELREVMLEILTAVCKLNPEQQAAWQKLVDCVYDIIFKAMDDLAK